MYVFSELRDEVKEEVLDSMLFEMVKKMQKYDYMMYPIFKVLYDHGFRISEVLEAERWQLKEDGKFTIKTEKGSLPRYLNYSEVEIRYRKELQYNEYRGSLLNYSQVKRRFESYFGATFFTENNRRLITHLFRHNFVKKKFREGVKIEEIAKIIGEVNEANVWGYVQGKIYKEKWQKLQF